MENGESGRPELVYRATVPSDVNPYSSPRSIFARMQREREREEERRSRKEKEKSEASENGEAQNYLVRKTLVFALGHNLRGWCTRMRSSSKVTEERVEGKQARGR